MGWVLYGLFFLFRLYIDVMNVKLIFKNRICFQWSLQASIFLLKEVLCTHYWPLLPLFLKYFLCSLGGKQGWEKGNPGCLQSSHCLSADSLPWNISHFPVPCSFSDYQLSPQFLRSRDDESWWSLEKVYPVSVHGGRAMVCYLCSSTLWLNPGE